MKRPGEVGTPQPGKKVLEFSSPGAGPGTPLPARPRSAPAEATARPPAAAHACAGGGSVALPGGPALLPALSLLASIPARTVPAPCGG